MSRDVTSRRHDGSLPPPPVASHSRWSNRSRQPAVSTAAPAQFQRGDARARPGLAAAIDLDEHRPAVLACRQLAQRAGQFLSGVRSSRVSGAPSHGRNCRRPPRSRASPRSRTALAGRAGASARRKAGARAERQGWRVGRAAAPARASTAPGHRRGRAAGRQCRQGIEEERRCAASSRQTNCVSKGGPLR